MQIVECHGTGLQRGLAHGESIRDRVRSALAKWEAATLSAPGKPAKITDYVADFLNKTGLFARVQRDFPDLADEVAGIAQGAGLPMNLIAAYNLMDEQWWHDMTPAEPGCSLVAVLGPQGTVIAQNMDLPVDMDGSQIVLRLSGPNQPQALILSAAGMIGLTGANRDGVAICVNTLLMLNHRAQGSPVAFVLRRALQERSAAAAVQVLQGLNHASGQHYAVAGPRGVTGLECSAAGAVISATGPVLLHTNHPLASHDIDQTALDYLTGFARIENSQARLTCLQGRVGPTTTAAQVQALLSDASLPMCMVAGEASRSQTFGTVLFQLGAQVQAQFRLAGPGRAEWADVGFTA